jgi:hypothetical protein
VGSVPIRATVAAVAGGRMILILYKTNFRWHHEPDGVSRMF